MENGIKFYNLISHSPGPPSNVSEIILSLLTLKKASNFKGKAKKYTGDVKSTLYDQ